MIDSKFIFIIVLLWNEGNLDTPNYASKEKKNLDSNLVTSLMERTLDQKSRAFWFILIMRLWESYLVFLSLRLSSGKWE